MMRLMKCIGATKLTLAALLSLLGLTLSCGTYDPCEDRSCGQSCQVCDPDDSECTEPPGAKFCNDRGVCATSQTPPACG